jgi:hypothetical protein
MELRPLPSLVVLVVLIHQGNPGQLVTMALSSAVDLSIGTEVLTASPAL